MNLSKLLLSVIFALLFFSAISQAPQPPAPLDVKEQKEVIDSVSRLLNETYVFPEVAKKMAALLQANLKKGDYTSITSGPAFAKRLTDDLRSISNDKHLSVQFNPQNIQQIRANSSSGNSGPSAASLEQMRMNNYGFKEIKFLEGNIGYLDLRSFTNTTYGGETAVAAMNFLSNSNALIIDLRNNGGGSPAMIQLITSYLFGPEPVHLNNFYYRPTDENTQTWTLPHVVGKRRPDMDVYVLTSKKTFSAAEEFTYDLKNLKRATIIGETTGGGAHPGGNRIATDRFMVWVPTGRAINPITKTNWEGTGVKPDIEVKAADALATAHIKALESLHAKASGPAKKKYEWQLTSLKASKEKIEIDEATLKSYAGTFGEKKLVFEEGTLYFYPFPDQKVKLTPMSKDLFALTDINNVRLRILSENNVVTGVEELFDNGQTYKFDKTKTF